MHIANLLAATINCYPNRPALICGERRWSYAEWYGRIVRFALSLSTLGLRPTDRVALYVGNGEALVTSYFAAQLLGAVAVPINPRLAQGEVAAIIEDSGARILVYGGPLTGNALAVAACVRTVHDFISCAEGPDEVPTGHHRFGILAERAEGAALDLPAIEPSQLSALIYTSGTTGRPKGVMHTHANDVAIAMNCVMEYGLSQNDVALHTAPLCHVGGMQAYFIPHLMVGGTNIIVERYNPAETLETIARRRVTTLFLVPTQIQEMLLQPGFAALDLSSLRMITTGGAAITAPVMERVVREFCPNVYNGYGMTEASLTLLLQPGDALSHLGSCGRPTLISQCRIVDPGSEIIDAPTGTVGELLVKGPQMTPGYWNNPAETRRRIRDGWLHTGDLFSRDEAGFYFFRGRSDDMIVSGGENIYPREIEEVLAKCPGLKETAIVGLPDSRWGQAVTAFVVRAAGDLTEKDVEDFCRASVALAAFKRPKRIIFVDALPTNASGKVLRRELVSWYGPTGA